MVDCKRRAGLIAPSRCGGSAPLPPVPPPQLPRPRPVIPTSGLAAICHSVLTIQTAQQPAEAKAAPALSPEVRVVLVGSITWSAVQAGSHGFAAGASPPCDQSGGVSLQEWRAFKLVHKESLTKG